MKFIIVLALIGVVIALATAGAAMLRRREPLSPQEQDRRMARALAWRVGLSIALFLLVLLAWRLGWIEPVGLPMSRS